MTKKDFEELTFQLECDITTLVFVILKFVGVINWAWFWVISPIIILIITKLVSKNMRI